jgi:VanZ family protein
VRRALVALGPIAAYLAVIFYLSSRPPGDGADIPHFDKVLHLVEYGILGGLCARAAAILRLVAPDSQTIALCAALCSLYGASDEFHQSFTPGRVVDVWDWAVDTLGGGLGAALWLRLRPRATLVGEGKP